MNNYVCQHYSILQDLAITQTILYKALRAREVEVFILKINNKGLRHSRSAREHSTHILFFSLCVVTAEKNDQTYTPLHLSIRFNSREVKTDDQY